MKTFLVTGGSGFIGSNFILHFLRAHPDYHVVNLDRLSYAASQDNLRECADDPRYKFVLGNICDEQLIAKLFESFRFAGVIHFAAESHVDNSIGDPRAFMVSNFMGTFTLLETARRHWMRSPGVFNPGYEGCRFHHVSTDEVYGSLGDTGLFDETSPYAPNSPYSASKAGSDFIVRAYHHTYGMNVTTSNCSNNYGPRQHAEKFIPTIIDCCLSNRPIPIYGNGLHVRDWLYVTDHCRAVDMIWHRAQSGRSYNIGAACEKNNLEIAALVCSILDRLKPRKTGSYIELINHVKDRPGHDRRYAIDATRIHTELGWAPCGTLEGNLEKTVLWYLEKQKTSEDYRGSRS